MNHKKSIEKRSERVNERQSERNKSSRAMANPAKVNKTKTSDSKKKVIPEIVCIHTRHVTL